MTDNTKLLDEMTPESDGIPHAVFRGTIKPKGILSTGGYRVIVDIIGQEKDKEGYLRLHESWANGLLAFHVIPAENPVSEPEYEPLSEPTY